MTIHSLKGLEFDHVFVVGFDREEIFPGYRSIGNAEAMEEERRLAYVAITRLEKNCIYRMRNNACSLAVPNITFLRDFLKSCQKKPQVLGAAFDNVSSDSAMRGFSSSSFGKKTSFSQAGERKRALLQI